MGYVLEFEPFLMRKLYLLNGAHATLGFMSQVKGIALVHEALRDPEIREATAGHLQEANEGVSREYHLDEEDQEGYIEKVLHRFQNEAIRDATARLSRGQIRKLQRTERLIGPALLALKYGVEPTSIATGLAFLLRHYDPKD